MLTLWKLIDDDGNKAVKTPENYTKGELPGVTKRKG